ncbi:hypothetical protein [Mesorhizobium sp. INR15]|uniref:hypothetical protein n=1 Tax=Mesorhizobium sp. INR15 TaxID=2654248 RepID=UPI0018969779|nr:hypothetical protein [Mesorhizobium sp. INR15]QPC94256.1 hypothetical protein GA829_28740 [Mesorhizobium sp. INR15]
MSDPGEPPFTVLVFDMARTGKPDGEHQISGFGTLEDATAYAIARVRGSVEELRKPGITAAELRQFWSIHGEDCTVLNSPVRGSDLLDLFVATPAAPAERNWQALAPRLRRFRAGLLLSNDNDESVWCGGFFRATYKLSRQGLLDRFGTDATAIFVSKGITPAVATKMLVSGYFELPDPPYPPPGVTLRSWKVEVGFVCHDVKFGGDASGVFAWPDEPVDWALRTMQFLLMADMMAMRGDGPDWANDCDVLSVKVTETDAAPEYPLD